MKLALIKRNTKQKFKLYYGGVWQLMYSYSQETVLSRFSFLFMIFRTLSLFTVLKLFLTYIKFA